MTEKEYKERLKNNEPALRSCWVCNPAHKHLKKADYLIWCFNCGKMYFKGKQLKKLEKDPKDENK